MLLCRTLVKVVRKADRVTKVLLQFIYHVEEMEWAIEEALKTGMVVAATMAISVKGDMNGVPAGECAVRMARAGAQVGEWSSVRKRVIENRYRDL